MTPTVMEKPAPSEIIEAIILKGDLSKLTPEERTVYYTEVCRSVGLNPLTRPLEYITLSGRLVLYVRKDATDQLRKLHQVSISITAREKVDDLYVVTARATLPDGRTDESIGAVNLAGRKGDDLANQLMKCETKAKRRVTLSACGLGMLDESELETIPEVRERHQHAQVSQAQPSREVPRIADKIDLLALCERKGRTWKQCQRHLESNKKTPVPEQPVDLTPEQLDFLVASLNQETDRSR